MTLDNHALHTRRAFEVIAARSSSPYKTSTLERDVSFVPVPRLIHPSSSWTTFAGRRTLTMFFTPELLQRRDSGFGLIWLAATLGSKSALRKLPRKGILSADIPQLCEMISSPPEPLALRLSANLMVGVIRVYHARHDIWAADVTHTFTNLKKAVNAMYAESGALALEMPQGTIRADMITLPDAGDRTAIDFNIDFDFNFDFAAMNKEWEEHGTLTPAPRKNPRNITLDESHILDAPDVSMMHDYDFDFNFDFGPTRGHDSSSAVPRSSRIGGAGSHVPSSGNEPFISDIDLGLADGGIDQDGRINLGLGLEDEGWAAQGWGGEEAGPGAQLDLGLDIDMNWVEPVPASPSENLSSVIRKDMTAGPHRKPRKLGLNGSNEQLGRERTPSLTHSQESPPSVDELDALPPGIKRPGEQLEVAKKKKKRVRLLLDARTELTDAELVANREGYHDNMLTARAEAQDKAPKPWVMDLLFKDIPDAYEAPELRECFANVIKSNLEARKRRWEEEAEDERTVRRRVDVAQEVEHGRGDGMIVYPDDDLQAQGWEQPQYEYEDMNSNDPGLNQTRTPKSILRPSLTNSVEQGRGASILHEISQKSNSLPWDNLDVDGGPSSSWAPFSVTGARSSDGMVGLFSPRPEGSISGSRGRRGSREGSLIPSELGSTPRQSFGAAAAGPLEEFGGFVEAPLLNQTQSQSQSLSQDPATLERNSYNFLELVHFLIMSQHGLPPGAGPTGITLDGVLPEGAKTKHVAASAFYNCLVLATKSLITVEQDEAYGDISVYVL
ncbi:hypothetical protein DACRYDRAFT_119082 [Dacryopinax primogenitus]|uniref:Rad21/Rec8-like protein N-terminal domain-containing protein n=1 Tax=Dacryopinax primogenitus (strain DJM 731) TaxID=1858805 RepID=M5FRZ7_DACPD|nr:uncharacterized protein DACRYDRAFT_119082 [Dacryopinax primogenitus]EJT97869.1 hypothetical protein DACRYDRAFT_119082 [Dacryopinax primogenitus]